MRHSGTTVDLDIVCLFRVSLFLEPHHSECALILCAISGATYECAWLEMQAAPVMRET